MMRRIVFLCLAAVLSSSSARADESDVNPLVLADRLELEAQALLGKGRCGEGARLMSKAWRLRAEAWGAEMRPEPHPPMPPGGPAMPRPPHAPRPGEAWHPEMRMPKFHLGDADREMLAAAISQLRAQSNELEQAAQAAKAAGDEAKAREKMEASGRAWKKAEELERALRESGEKREHAKREKAEHERAAAEEHKARLAEAHEKLARLQGEASAWAEKAKAFRAEGFEEKAVDAEGKAKEAAERAEHLRQRLAAAAGTPPKDARPEKGALEAEVRRLRAEVEELKAHLDALRQHLESLKR